MKPIFFITVIVAIFLGLVIFWLAGGPGYITPDADRTEIQRDQPALATNDAGPAEATDDATTQVPAEPPGFCERDFDQVAEREADVPDLREAGGLVYIFEREARLEDPYGCADFYLAHGLDIDAADPREGGEKLTGLFYAIQRNDPKMLRFMIDHGADLEQRAGKNDTRAMGYAYFLALKDQRIDRNGIIGILDSELTRQASANDSSSANATQDNDAA
ncbi:ankyrin repeat domain-containing protein [uncultured Salinisphaera sp.]|uniref:ankyrin repeat domain-containing protein n=1 Tax=uncultured Salinisphaera sp. TaxID=359372 RepID=UPI0032B16E26